MLLLLGSWQTSKIKNSPAEARTKPSTAILLQVLLCKILLNAWFLPIVAPALCGSSLLFANLGWKRVEGIFLLHKQPWDGFHVLEAPNVLQNYQQVAVGHHEGRGQHGVAPPVPHHPEHAGPDEEDKCQPADICDAPRLKRTHNTPNQWSSAQFNPPVSLQFLCYINAVFFRFFFFFLMYDP